MRKHLAIFAPEVVKEIFSGKKIIETRFSQKRIAPFGEVSVGDVVYIKPAGDEIKGQFLVKKVIFFEGLDAKDWQLIQKNYILTSQDLVLRAQNARYGTVIFIDRVEKFITPPVK